VFDHEETKLGALGLDFETWIPPKPIEFTSFSPRASKLMAKG